VQIRGQRAWKSLKWGETVTHKEGQIVESQKEIVNPNQNGKCVHKNKMRKGRSEAQGPTSFKGKKRKANLKDRIRGGFDEGGWGERNWRELLRSDGPQGKKRPPRVGTFEKQEGQMIPDVAFLEPTGNEKRIGILRLRYLKKRKEKNRERISENQKKHKKKTSVGWGRL